MQLATIVSMLVYTSIHLSVTLNLCSRMRTTVQRDINLYARYLCSRDALGLKAKRARDDRVYCIQDINQQQKFKDISCRKRSHCCDTVRVKSHGYFKV